MKPSLLLPLAAAACALAVAKGAVDFEAEVLPILEDHCIDCHGDEKQKSALRLDTALGLLRGGESGEALLVGGKSAESYLFKRVSTAVAKDAMPPKGERLSAEQVAVLQRWIDEGAAVPGAEEARKELRITTDHWSFQPVKRLEGGKGDGIDGLVRAKLLEKGLLASPEADRTTLIRRNRQECRQHHGQRPHASRCRRHRPRLSAMCHHHRRNISSACQFHTNGR